MNLAWAVLSVFAATIAAPLETPLQRFAKSELHMAVEFEVVVYAADAATAEKAFQAAFAQIESLNAKLSDYDAESELSKLSEQAGSDRAIPISDDLLKVLLASQQISEKSGGAFDVTVGPLTKLWRRARRQKELPSEERIAEATTAVGFRALQLDEPRKTATLTRPNMRLDLGGIAKGYAADEALQAIVATTGMRRALVRASGDIAVGDPPPDETGWKIGLAPLEPDAPPEKFVRLANAAVSTSGDARQHLELAGRRYSHLIDPRSAAPLEGRSGVTIIARRGMIADGLASAVSVLGPEAGLKLVEASRDVAGSIVWEGVDGKRHASESQNFSDYLVAP